MQGDSWVVEIEKWIDNSTLGLMTKRLWYQFQVEYILRILLRNLPVFYW
jgi:hypothetical protein